MGNIFSSGNGKERKQYLNITVLNGQKILNENIIGSSGRWPPIYPCEQCGLAIIQEEYVFNCL